MILIQSLQRFFYSVRFTLGLMVSSLVGVILIMLNTSPLGLGPAGMLLAFAAFYLWFFSLFLGGVHVTKTLRRHEDNAPSFMTGRLIMLSAAWAFAPLILLALQSIGQLEVVSLGLVILFEVLISVYIIKR